MGMEQGMASRCWGAPERWGWPRESSNSRCSDGTGACVVLWEKSQLGEGLPIAKFPQNPQSLPGVTWEGQGGDGLGRGGQGKELPPLPTPSKGNVPQDGSKDLALMAS